MNKEKILGVIRHILGFVGMWFVSKGWLDEGTANELVGAVLMIVSVGWSWFAPEKKLTA